MFTIDNIEDHLQQHSNKICVNFAIISILSLLFIIVQCKTNSFQQFKYIKLLYIYCLGIIFFLIYSIYTKPQDTNIIKISILVYIIFTNIHYIIYFKTFTINQKLSKILLSSSLLAQYTILSFYTEEEYINHPSISSVLVYIIITLGNILTLVQFGLQRTFIILPNILPSNPIKQANVSFGITAFGYICYYISFNAISMIDVNSINSLLPIIILYYIESKQLIAICIKYYDLYDIMPRNDPMRTIRTLGATYYTLDNDLFKTYMESTFSINSFLIILFWSLCIIYIPKHKIQNSQ